MQQITENEFKYRVLFDNPWWVVGGGIDSTIAGKPRRMYFQPFTRLVLADDDRPAALLGSRQVGKTVLLQHTIKHLLDTGTAPEDVFYVSMENPLFAGMDLQSMVKMFLEIQGHSEIERKLYVFIDGIQYARNWASQLAGLAKNHPGIRFIASGTVAPTLVSEQADTGPAPFVDFHLPPLTFAEYLRFRRVEEELFNPGTEEWTKTLDIGRLNQEFLGYLNGGGFPERLFQSEPEHGSKQFYGNDIIDKVLLRDLPNLYAIRDTQELNRLFSQLAFNSGNEVSLEELSKTVGVAKNTLRKYLDYLEAAFLIHRVHRVDQTAARFRRATAFKVYLTNPSLRAALFGGIGIEDAAMANLAETAVVAQIAHFGVVGQISYARWRSGQVNIVGIDQATGDIWTVVDINWNNDAPKDRKALRSPMSFVRKNGLDQLRIKTRNSYALKTVKGIKVLYSPVAEYVYHLGKLPVEILRENSATKIL
mgnify:CR=1 FL=1